MQNPFDIPLKKLEAALRQEIQLLPARIGAEVVRFSNEAFRRQGWQGNAFMPWSRKGNSKNKGRAILIKTGRLRRSIRILRITADYVVIGTDVPYAKAHNEGFSGRVSVPSYRRNTYSRSKTGTGKFSQKTGKERTRTVTSVTGSTEVRAHTRYMKIRRNMFLGDSPYLRRDIERVIAACILKATKR